MTKKEICSGTPYLPSHLHPYTPTPAHKLPSLLVTSFARKKKKERKRKERRSSTAAMTTTTTTTTTTTITVQPEPITAQNILQLFPEIAASGNASTGGGNELDGHDALQVSLMEEMCIVLDENDKPIGSASKKICECPSVHPYYTIRTHYSGNLMAGKK